MLLIIYIAVATFFLDDFWNQAAPENGKMLVDALKNSRSSARCS